MLTYELSRLSSRIWARLDSSHHPDLWAQEFLIDRCMRVLHFTLENEPLAIIAYFSYDMAELVQLICLADCFLTDD